MSGGCGTEGKDLLRSPTLILSQVALVTFHPSRSVSKVFFSMATLELVTVDKAQAKVE